jgi:hypothetical protein
MLGGYGDVFDVGLEQLSLAKIFIAGPITRSPEVIRQERNIDGKCNAACLY